MLALLPTESALIRLYAVILHPILRQVFCESPQLKLAQERISLSFGVALYCAAPAIAAIPCEVSGSKYARDAGAFRLPNLIPL